MKKILLFMILVLSSFPLYALNLKAEGGEFGFYKGMPQFGMIVDIEDRYNHYDLGSRFGFGLDGNISAMIENKTTIVNEPDQQLNIFLGIGVCSRLFTQVSSDYDSLFIPIQMGAIWYFEKIGVEISKHSVKGLMLGMRIKG